MLFCFAVYSVFFHDVKVFVEEGDIVFCEFCGVVGDVFLFEVDPAYRVDAAAKVKHAVIIALLIDRRIDVVVRKEPFFGALVCGKDLVVKVNDIFRNGFAFFC